jgi:hypothetical protein
MISRARHDALWLWLWLWLDSLYASFSVVRISIDLTCLYRSVDNEVIEVIEGRGSGKKNTNRALQAIEPIRIVSEYIITDWQGSTPPRVMICAAQILLVPGPHSWKDSISLVHGPINECDSKPVRFPTETCRV